MNPIVLLISGWLIALNSAQVLPTSFDARLRWPNCPSIGRIPNQGCCNASYALIPAAMLTDRACIRSNGTAQTYSAYDAIACCPDCPFSPLRKCGGGDPAKVLNYFMTTGLASERCLPYTLDPLCLGLFCPLVCADGSSKKVADDRRSGLSQNVVSPLDIQVELYMNGPVISNVNGSAFIKSGLGLNRRRRQTNDVVSTGQITVKIIGWGTETENKEDYWLVIAGLVPLFENIGMVRVPRGIDYMGIETHALVATPIV